MSATTFFVRFPAGLFYERPLEQRLKTSACKNAETHCACCKCFLRKVCRIRELRRKNIGDENYNSVKKDWRKTGRRKNVASVQNSLKKSRRRNYKKIRKHYPRKKSCFCKNGRVRTAAVEKRNDKRRGNNAKDCYAGGKKRNERKRCRNEFLRFFAGLAVGTVFKVATERRNEGD